MNRIDASYLGRRGLPKCGASNYRTGSRDRRDFAELRMAVAQVRQTSPMMDQKPADPVAKRLRAFEVNLRADLGDRVQIVRSTLAKTLYQEVRVLPTNPQAIPVTWLEATDTEILVFAGPGGRWELGWTPGSAQFVEEVVSAAIDGRIRAVAAPARAAAYVELRDGSVERSSVSEGCLTALIPLPGWRGWGRKTWYEPY
jgi:hypothetical protein